MLSEISLEFVIFLVFVAIFVYHLLGFVQFSRKSAAMKSPDDTDRAIIAILQYDGRTPYTDIASDLGISEASARRRAKRLAVVIGLGAASVSPYQDSRRTPKQMAERLGEK